MTITGDSLIEYCIEHFGVDAEEIDATTPLFTTGLLDSFNLLGLVAYIEGEIGAKLKITEITLDNFDSIERIMQFLEARRA